MAASPTPSTGPAFFFISARYGGSSTMRRVSSSEMMPTGTLMKKIHRHDMLSVM